jgi:hypothetical protein
VQVPSLGVIPPLIDISDLSCTNNPNKDLDKRINNAIPSWNNSPHIETALIIKILGRINTPDWSFLLQQMLLALH